MREEAFSWRTRERILSDLESKYDLIVIGGGITGCGVSLETARRGFRVLLLEKGDIGSGTSSRSSRLIHGGLRYLKYGRLKLVREAGRERRRLRALYPYLVRPLRFVIPFYEGEGEGSLVTLFGLWLYDLLSGVRKTRRHRRLHREEVLAEEPRMRSEGLKGGALYYDCCTDDFRLVLLNAKMAHRAGVHILTYARVESIILEESRVTGVRFRDQLNGGTYEVRGRLLLNAAGPWSDQIRLMVPSGRERLRPTKGAHVLVPRSRVGNRNAVVMRSPRDGRVLFALPWHRFTIVGTTDTDFPGDPDGVRAGADDVEYLLEAVNHTFPRAALAPEDVVSSFAALRPLLREYGVSESEVSREYRIVEDARGLISVVGGKLTTYRRVSEKVASRIARILGHQARSSQTPSEASLAMTMAELEAMRPEVLEDLSTRGLDVEVADHLIAAYGPECGQLLDYIDEEVLRRRMVPELPYILAEVGYSVNHEMALRLEDVLARRTKVIYEDTEHGLGVAEEVAALMSRSLGWSEERAKQELRDYERVVASLEAFRKGG